MDRMICDAAIVGGGPAGLATAIFAAQRGLSTIVCEKGTLPLDKACGEGIMPRGVALLGQMGVEVPSERRYPFIGIRYVDGELEAQGRFTSRAGWGVRRTTLIEAMVERARELGVEILHGTKATKWTYTPENRVELATDSGPLDAGILIGADGLHSRIRREAGLEEPSKSPKRYGVRRHFQTVPWSQYVEVHWAAGAEAYVTPVGQNELGVAFLWSGGKSTFDSLLERFPDLGARLKGADPTSDARGAGPFRQQVTRRYRGPLALVGDAAGYIDALTGDGLSLSFCCARALVDAVASRRRLATYERDYRRLSRRHRWTTEALLRVSSLPWLRRRVISLLARSPALFDGLLALTMSPTP